MNTETFATCPRCERRRARRWKTGRVLDFALIAVLLADIWVTWGHRPAAPCACPAVEQARRAQ